MPISFRAGDNLRYIGPHDEWELMIDHGKDAVLLCKGKVVAIPSPRTARAAFMRACQ